MESLGGVCFGASPRDVCCILTGVWTMRDLDAITLKA
jgi:hypothetical protein